MLRASGCWPADAAVLIEYNRYIMICGGICLSATAAVNKRAFDFVVVS